MKKKHLKVTFNEKCEIIYFLSQSPYKTWIQEQADQLRMCNLLTPILSEHHRVYIREYIKK